MSRSFTVFPKSYIQASTRKASLDWRTLQVGDSLIYFGTDFSGSWSYPCTVTSVEEDHAIAYEPTVPMTHLWIDDATAHMFKRA